MEAKTETARSDGDGSTPGGSRTIPANAAATVWNVPQVLELLPSTGTGTASRRQQIELRRLPIVCHMADGRMPMVRLLSVNMPS